MTTKQINGGNIMLNENKKSTVIYIVIILLNIILSIPIFFYLTWYYICNIGNYLIENLQFPKST